MTVRVLVVDDEPDLELLFRQQFRRETAAPGGRGTARRRARARRGVDDRAKANGDG